MNKKDKKKLINNKKEQKLSENKTNKKGNEKMEKTIEKRKLDFFNKEEMDKITRKLPRRKVKDGVILLDRNNPDDVEWWNED